MVDELMSSYSSFLDRTLKLSLTRTATNTLRRTFLKSAASEEPCRVLLERSLQLNILTPDPELNLQTGIIFDTPHIAACR